MESRPELSARVAMTPVPPVHPAAPYVGGKRILAKPVIARIDAIEHDGYAEVFVGMAGVFLRRTQRPPVEVINDWSQDVATFFRILQRHYVAFLDMLRFQVTSRAGFDRLMATDPATLTDLERAARFLYLQRLAFGGKVAGRHFGVVPNGGARFNLVKLQPVLEELHERLAGVVIERLPWQDFIDRYDRPGMLMFLDPPYLGTEGFYGADLFDRSQFALMADRMRAMRSRFLMTINDHPDVRRIFAGFDMQEVGVRYTIGGMHKSKAAGELIISN